MSIHSFVEWLDTFSYVLRPGSVTDKEVNHIRCFAIAKYLILLSCHLAMEHLYVLQLETALATLVTTWFTLVDEGLDTAAMTSISLMLLGRRNATTAGSGNNLAAFHFFQFLSNDDNACNFL